MRKSQMLGPTKARFILVWINSINFITWNYIMLIKKNENKKIIKNQGEFM